MLILASLSGIQDFLFDVRESGGRQAKSLRHRSFYIQLLADCIAERLLEDARKFSSGRRPDLLFCAAAKLAIVAEDLSEEGAHAVRAVAGEINRWLLNNTHGRLRLSLAIEPMNGSFSAAFERASRTLAVAKLRPFKPEVGRESPSWEEGSLVAESVLDVDAEAERDAQVGGRLVRARWLVIERPDGERRGDAMNVAGLHVHLRNEEPAPSATLVSCSNIAEPEKRPHGVDESHFRVRRLARHIPRNAHGDPFEFVDLAARSRGSALLGVLKADVDSLGRVISQTLHESGPDGAVALRRLSDAIDRFFVDTLEAEKQRDPWTLIYTVFSGGDDMLVVGPWNTVLDFAGHMRRLFEQKFGASAQSRPCPLPLTISAGVAIIKPNYPIHHAAQQAERLLDMAKGESAAGSNHPKDQCAALGGMWKWTYHDAIIGAGKRLADWVDAGIIQRGWLHTLLELARLRRGQAGPKYAGVHPAVATSRLAYHVARNWPRQDDRDRRKGDVRAWIDAILREFDRYETTSHTETLHLPAIVRYAMMAGRD